MFIFLKRLNLVYVPDDVVIGVVSFLFMMLNFLGNDSMYVYKLSTRINFILRSSLHVFAKREEMTEARKSAREGRIGQKGGERRHYNSVYLKGLYIYFDFVVLEGYMVILIFLTQATHAHLPTPTQKGRWNGRYLVKIL